MTVAGTTVVIALTSVVSFPAVENVLVVVPQAVVFHSVTVTPAGADAGVVPLRRTVAEVGIGTTVVWTVEGDMVVMKEEETCVVPVEDTLSTLVETAWTAYSVLLLKIPLLVARGTIVVVRDAGTLVPETMVEPHLVQLTVLVV